MYCELLTKIEFLITKAIKTRDYTIVNSCTFTMNFQHFWTKYMIYNVTSDDSVFGRGFISHSPKISCQFATKIRMIRLTFMFTWTKNKIPFCPPLRPDFSKFSFCIFFIFGNHIENHTTFLQVLATAAENCWNYEARHETSIRSVNMVLSCIILILVANWQGIFG